MPRVRALIIVEGKVQKVGYRDKVQEIARESKLVGRVGNREDGTVEIICEGEKKAIEDFKRKIKIKDELIDVENITVAYAEATGEFKYFKVEYGEIAEEIGESVGAGRRELIGLKEWVKGLRGEIKGGFGSLRKGVGGLRKDVGGLRGDVSGLRKDVGGLRRTTSQGFSAVGGKVSDLKQEIGGLRKDVGGLRKDVGGLRKDTTQGFTAVKEEVHGLRNDMNQNFGSMDKKYLKISKNMETLTREIKNSNENIQLLAKTFVRMVNTLERKRS